MTGPTGAINLRPMGVGEILDQSLKVYGRAWKPLLTLGLISVTPMVFMTFWMQRQMTAPQTPSRLNLMLRASEAAGSGDFRSLPAVVGSTLLLMVIGWLISPLVQGGIILSSARTIEGHQVTVGGAFRLGASRYFPMLGTSILKGLPWLVVMALFFTGVWAVVLIIPMLVAYGVMLVYWMFAGQTVVLEGAPAGLRPFKRSFGLARGKFWRLVGIGLVSGLLMLVLTGIVMGLAAVLTSLGSVLGGGRGLGVVVALLNALTSAATAPFVFVGMTVVYYDLRVRTEGLDLEMQARAQLESGQL